MPDMDGLTATRWIRTSENPSARIAIVGLTAGTGAENLATCLDAGMDAVTTKPVTLLSLRAAIADGRAACGKRCVAEGPDAMTPRLRELARMLGDDAVQEIIHAFQEDAQALVARMREAVARDDSNTIYGGAHTLAGAARNVGAGALAECASTLEQMIGSLSPTQLAARIEMLQTELHAALTSLSTDFKVASK